MASIARRLLLGLVTCGALLAGGEHSLVEGAGEDYCPAFHEECTEAQAQGAVDAGICTVERLECTSAPRDEPTRGVGKTPRGARAAGENARPPASRPDATHAR